MNKDQFTNLLTTIMSAVGVAAATYGILDSVTWTAIGGAVVALGVFVYTHLWNKSA